MISTHRKTIWVVLGTLFGLIVFPSLAQAKVGRETQRPPNSRPGNSQTTLGVVVKAELLIGTQITIPSPPVNKGPQQAHMEAASPAKGKKLLLITFERRMNACLKFDRDIQVVKDGDGRKYLFGAWQFYDSTYGLCGPPDFAMPVVGPWLNTFWDPITIRVSSGTFCLVYEIDPELKGLSFTDGKVVVDLDLLLKR